MTFRILWIAALLAAPLFAEEPSKRCTLCGGEKKVKCFSCDGKTGAQVTCPSCQGGGFSCPGCQASGKAMCIACGGTGKCGVESLKCMVCGGMGKLDCKVCDNGKIPCQRCKGSAKVQITCPTCGKTGHLRCPDCNPYAAASKCPSCNGSKKEKCLLCAGSGTQSKPCDVCRGRQVSACTTCYGHGRQTCQRCGGCGKYRKNGDMTKTLQQCDTCGGKGWANCSACKGKGVDRCLTCEAKGGTDVPCAWCAGAKTIACRRCVGEQKCWTGKEAKSGATVTILPCQDLEPQFSVLLNEAAKFVDYKVWRVIVDNREGTAPITLGGTEGFTLSGLHANDAEAPTLDPTYVFNAETRKAVEAKLPSWGAAPDAFQAPVKVQKGEIAVRLWVSDKSVAPDEKAFRMRLVSDANVTADLPAKELTVDGWIRICAQAAAAMRPPKK